MVDTIRSTVGKAADVLRRLRPGDGGRLNHTDDGQAPSRPESCGLYAGQFLPLVVVVLFGGLGALTIYYSFQAREAFLGLGGVVALAYSVYVLIPRRRPAGGEDSGVGTARAVEAVEPAGPTDEPPADEDEGLAGAMCRQGRYGLMLRKESKTEVDESELGPAWAALERRVALVPLGEFLMGGGQGRSDLGTLVQVDSFYLDRTAVTNRQYQAFVDAGGYELIELWPMEIWPSVLEFRDPTGRPGPRYWRNGRYPAGREDHPVVGVSWYEAQAYATWVGKRLPQEREWEKAGSWPAQLTSTAGRQRRYPWGNTIDRRRCNVWGSAVGETLAVTAMEEGATPNGILQLAGNVWEWTADDFEAQIGERAVVLAAPMKVIRGGAFDTYFDSQASCQFRTGQEPLDRRHNIGFRCAIGLAELRQRTVGREAEKGDVEMAEMGR